MKTLCILNAVVAPLLLLSALVLTETMASVITPSLLSRLEKGEKVTVIVKMARSTEEALERVEAKHIKNRNEKGAAVNKELEALAVESQKHLKEFMDAQKPPVKYESFWISNTLFVYDATLDIVKKLESLGGIKEIREEQTVHLMKSGGIGIGMGGGGANEAV